MNRFCCWCRKHVVPFSISVSQCNNENPFVVRRINSSLHRSYKDGMLFIQLIRPLIALHISLFFSFLGFPILKAQNAYTVTCQQFFCIFWLLIKKYFFSNKKAPTNFSALILAQNNRFRYVFSLLNFRLFDRIRHSFLYAPMRMSHEIFSLCISRSTSEQINEPHSPNVR